MKDPKRKEMTQTPDKSKMLEESRGYVLRQGTGSGADLQICFHTGGKLSLTLLAEHKHHTRETRMHNRSHTCA